jgi:hypothetical protein
LYNNLLGYLESKINNNLIEQFTIKISNYTPIIEL